MKRMNGRLVSLRRAPLSGAERRVLRCARCGARTSGGKRYCAAHLAGMPYVASLLRRLDAWRPARERDGQAA